MKLPIANLGAAVADWMDKELVPKASGWQQLLTIVAGVGISNNAVSRIQQYIPLLEVLGFIDENKNIDLALLNKAAKEAFAKTGKIRVLGIVIGPEDVDSMMTIAKKFSLDTVADNDHVTTGENHVSL